MCRFSRRRKAPKHKNTLKNVAFLPKVIFRLFLSTFFRFCILTFYLLIISRLNSPQKLRITSISEHNYEHFGTQLRAFRNFFRYFENIILPISFVLFVIISIFAGHNNKI